MGKKKAKPTTNPWPKRLRELRRRLDLTQAQAAERVCVCRWSWVAWENDYQLPSRHIQLLLDLLDQNKI